MADTDKAMQELDDLFASARQNPVPLPDHLATAIMNDALVARSEERVPQQEPENRRQVHFGIWRQLMVAIGGLPALGGMAAACVVGVWVGLAPPSFLPDPAQLVGYSDSTSVPYDSYDLASVLGEEVQ
ncbi:hypothetical protein DL239_01525 [Sedimentitalea sp. CY04]|uniref:Dihydroorotate dehydrogenase n=1 Tax=Parasedimentitalea denitrificans TaxID=2211118 RepID=A0ABX0W1Z2_9RHOB|nr:hypothetical protein [Sedimentitalea sp. CY04]NIZ59648.1 hypothetical protein [Sedimentitalea sp. CY04]